jgi:CRISPR-associated protein Csd2
MFETVNPIIFDPIKKHDAIWLFDCTDGNPNGDPDADNLPRTDAETQDGLISDGALKRKVRNTVELVAEAQETAERYKIYVQEGAILNKQQERAYTALKLQPDKKDQSKVEQAKAWMCNNFYDVRMFGAVMSTGNFVAGQVRGPVQINFARSLSPIFPQQLAITRCAATAVKEEKQLAQTMGRKAILSYGLYKAYVFFSPRLAKQTGVDENDLRLFWQALMICWESDRSAARGFMATRKLVIFTHESPLGNTPVHKLFERLDISKHPEGVARSFSDYNIVLNQENLSEGVTVTVLN